jgi:hypothetical protein
MASPGQPTAQSPSTSQATASQQHSANLFNGEAMPTPPSQNKAWTPPESKLGETLIGAAKTLFEQGLADPRDCDYREVAVFAGTWGEDGGSVKTHAWLLPADGKKQRFAVCWNGLVYPVFEVGAATDLKADVLATIKADEDRRAEQTKRTPNFQFTRFIDHATPQFRFLSHAELQPLMACLLLRMGETALAEKIWDTWVAGIEPPNVNNYDVLLRDPYVILAMDWTWALFDRARCAHLCGHDRLALLSARALEPISKTVLQVAKDRKL